MSEIYALDFEYDGRFLSDYGMIVCDFDYSDGTVEADIGSIISFNKVAMHYGKRYGLANTTYDECLTCSFDICKDPSIYDRGEDSVIESDLLRSLVRWLNRRSFHLFSPIPDGVVEAGQFYFNASCNVSKIKIAEKVYGLRLVWETDRPFAFGKPIISTLKLSKEKPTIFVDRSDEVGVAYPVLKIVCKEGGDLTLANKLTKSSMTIKNCKADEIITIDGEFSTIESSIGHDVSDDFNYDFFTIGNTLASRRNEISTTLNCDLTLNYRPVIKEVV